MIVVAWNTDHVELTQDSLGAASPVLAFTPVEWQLIIDTQAAGGFPNPTLPLQIASNPSQGSGWDIFRLDDPSTRFFVPRWPDMGTFIISMQEGDYALDKLNPPTP